MDYRLMHAAFRAKIGRATDKSVLIALCSMVSTDVKQPLPDSVTVFMSLKTMTDYTELNERTLGGCIERLEALSAIGVIKEHGKPSRYIININAITTCKFTGSSKITGTCNFTGSRKSAKQPPVNLQEVPPVNLHVLPPVNLQDKDSNDLKKNKDKSESTCKFTGSTQNGTPEFDYQGVIHSNEQNFVNRFNGGKHETSKRINGKPTTHAERIAEYAAGCEQRAADAIRRLHDSGQFFDENTPVD